VLSRLPLSAALIVAAMSCGVPPAAKSETAQSAPTDQSTPYADWTETPEGACAFMRAEIAAGRPEGQGELSERPYEPALLPGFSRLNFTPADSATAQRVFGRSCGGIENVWAVSTSALDLREDEPGVLFAVVRQPMMLRLPGGRNVVLAPVMPGDSHATNGFYAAFVLNSTQQQPFAMAEGSSFGAAGTLSAPSQQPLGAFHVWLEGGGTWQGYTQGWAGVTDFAGATPQHRGRFRIYGDFPCQRESEASGGRRVNRRTQTLTARYELRGGVYRLMEGTEPPRA
jgi:hypothetical protein